MIYAYVRVSSREQNEDRQLLAMWDVDVSDKNIFVDKQSGKDFNRCFIIRSKSSRVHNCTV